MRHKEWKMGTMVERIQPIGPPNLLNNMEGADRAVRGAASTWHAQYMLTRKVAETWPVCTVCNGWVMLLVCMGKTHFGGIIWGKVVMIHAQKIPISMYFLYVPAYLLKGCTLH